MQPSTAAWKARMPQPVPEGHRQKTDVSIAANAHTQTRTRTHIHTYARTHAHAHAHTWPTRTPTPTRKKASCGETATAAMEDMLARARTLKPPQAECHSTCAHTYALNAVHQTQIHARDTSPHSYHE
eukprot:6188559-Pleurochrysis_carterae.AAC.1